MLVFLLVVLTGCSQKIKTEEQNSSDKVSEADEAAQTSNKGTPLYDGDPSVEVLPWPDSPENHEPSFDETIAETEFDDWYKILPFVLLEGEFWYWKGNHWELGPGW